MKTFIVLATLLCTTSVYAQFRHNPYSGKWEAAGPNDQLQYNAFENEWTYEQPGSRNTYNPYENRWEYVPPQNDNYYESPGRSIDRWYFDE